MVANRMEPRLKAHYERHVRPTLQKEFEFTNLHQVPKLVKVVLNVGMGEAAKDQKLLESLVDEMTIITGQKALVNKARMAIANFNLREGAPIGVSVTLRREKMWFFLDRLVSTAIPRVRDFRGLQTKSFDGRGNYTMGIREQIIFSEIDYEKIDKIKGMSITFTTTAGTDERGRALLTALGLPFRK